MDVTAIAAGHAITPVPVKVVALCLKTDRRTVRGFRGNLENSYDQTLSVLLFESDSHRAFQHAVLITLYISLLIILLIVI